MHAHVYMYDYYHCYYHYYSELDVSYELRAEPASHTRFLAIETRPNDNLITTAMYSTYEKNHRDIRIIVSYIYNNNVNHKYEYMLSNTICI